MQQHFRPLGLSLAILLSFLFFGFWPLVPALFVLLLRLQGRDFTPVYSSFWLPSAAGAGVIILCIFAWLGRPTRVRWIFLGAVLLSAIAGVYSVLRPDQMTFVLEFSGGSLDSVFRSVQLCVLPMQLLALLYTLWYTNRAPAREFFSEAQAR